METEKKANNTMQVELTKRSLLRTSGKCFVLASITAILGMLLLTGCASATPQTEQQGQTVEQAEQQAQPEAKEGGSISYTEKEVPIFKDADTGETVGLRFYEDQPNVAYINIADYYHLFFPDKEMTVQESGTDADVYTVVNATGSATVDTAEETISSEDMAAFTNVMILTQDRSIFARTTRDCICRSLHFVICTRIWYITLRFMMGRRYTLRIRMRTMRLT